MATPVDVRFIMTNLVRLAMTNAVDLQAERLVGPRVRWPVHCATRLATDDALYNEMTP
jgi:hypothetical protein